MALRLKAASTVFVLLLALSIAFSQAENVESVHVIFDIRGDGSVDQTTKFIFASPVSGSTSYSVNDIVRNLRVTDGTDLVGASLQRMGAGYDIVINLEKPAGVIEIFYTVDNTVFSNGDIKQFFTQLSFGSSIASVESRALLPEGYGVYQNSYLPDDASITSDGKRIILSWNQTNAKDVIYSVKYSKLGSDSPLAIAVIALLAAPAYAKLGAQKFANVDFNDSAVTDVEIAVAKAEFGRPGILPGHPLYFLKRFGEGIVSLLAFSAESKAEVHLDFARERLAEAKALAEKNMSNLVESAVEEFRDEIGKAGEFAASNETARQRSKDVLEKSRVILSLLKEKVPDRAKIAIDNAINKSSEGIAVAVTKPEIHQSLRDRLLVVERERGSDISKQVEQAERTSGKQPAPSVRIEDISISRIDQNIPFVATLPG